MDSCNRISGKETKNENMVLDTEPEKKEIIEVLKDTQVGDIREIHQIDDLNKIVDLQCKVWGFNAEDAIPSHFLKAVNKIGGVVLGATDKNGSIVGFCCSVLGNDTDGPYHYLHMIGVDPSIRGKNIGFEILKNHYEISKNRNIKKITWTYDPLEPINANLYIKKIGGIVKSPYLEDEYGQNIQGLNNNIPSDRFLISRDISDEIVSKKIKKEYVEQNDESKINENCINPLEYTQDSMNNKDKIYVQIPDNFQKIKETDFALAKRWRQKTKEIFTYYLANGYIINDFITIKKDGNRNNYYQLEKKGV